MSQEHTPTISQEPSLPRTSQDLPLAKRSGRSARLILAAAIAAVALVPGMRSAAQSSGGATTRPAGAAQQQPQQRQPAGAQGQEQAPESVPVSADDPQPRDPFAADPFAPEAEAPAPRAADAGEANVTYDSAAETVEIHVSDADLLDVLRMLSVQSQKNIVASKDVRGTVTCNLFDVTVAEALDAILRSNGFVAREEGNFIYVYTVEELQALEEQNRQQETRVFRLYHIPPAMAAQSIEPSLSESAVISVTADAETGVASSREQAGGFDYSNGDMLIVRDFPERLDEVARIIAEIDHRPEQVLIEATILSTRLTENNAFGVDFNVVGGVDFSSFTSNNGQITGADVGDTGDNPIHGAGTGTNFTGGIPGGLKLGFVSNNVSAFVAALEGVTDTTVLANPKVLALNKQRGEVLVGREDGYLTTTLTETAATQQIEFLQTGTRLIFRPYIGRDGYVRMEIHPEDSTGGLNAANLPFKSTTEVTSNVMIKDGHTIVIGGLFRESSSVNRSQIPILGNLPVIGAAFRRQADVTEREEIIILLTPHIVKDQDKYSRLSEEELKRAEKLRVGTRKGMMPTGRERMSQVYYERAVRELSKNRPNRDRALHSLNKALNLNPTFIEAIELKERLTGRVVVEADGSTIRAFVRNAIRKDVAEGGPQDPQRGPDRDPVVPQPQDVLPVSSPTTRPSGPGLQMISAEMRRSPATQPSTQPANGPATQPAKGATTRPADLPSEWTDALD